MSVTRHAAALVIFATGFCTAAIAPVAAQVTPTQTVWAETIKGRWINPAESVVIAVAPCGEHQCGTVEWASDEAREDARKGTDQLVGEQLLSKVRPTSDGRWQGRLFVPDVNRHVHAKIELIDSNRLKVSGCAIGKSLCKSQVWSRLEASDQ